MGPPGGFSRQFTVGDQGRSLLLAVADLEPSTPVVTSTPTGDSSGRPTKGVDQGGFAALQGTRHDHANRPVHAYLRDAVQDRDQIVPVLSRGLLPNLVPRDSARAVSVARMAVPVVAWLSAALIAAARPRRRRSRRPWDKPGCSRHRLPGSSVRAMRFLGRPGSRLGGDGVIDSHRTARRPDDGPHARLARPSACQTSAAGMLGAVPPRCGRARSSALRAAAQPGQLRARTCSGLASGTGLETGSAPARMTGGRPPLVTGG